MLSADPERITLSTKHLEASPGDMLCDRQSVFDKAEERAAEFRKRRATIAALQVKAGSLCRMLVYLVHRSTCVL